MKYSKLFGKTSKSIPHDADSANAKYLVQGGFVHRETAGVYSYLPLGLKVLANIERIIREEMEAIGGQEILMPVLTPKENWATTNRWETLDVLFRLKGAGDKDYALGATHEEIVTPLVKDYVFSYKDLPAMVFQIQNKFRNEPRAKSGILRGREFGMKDLYSFHKSQEDLDAYYEVVMKAYSRIFERIGFDPAVTFLTYASGGAFCKYSHEYQIVSDFGEDHIYICEKCHVAINREILNDQKSCPKCGGSELTERKGIEIGNIFKLGTRFTDAFKFQFTDETGKLKPVIMGCYGIGPTRIMGTVVEISNDEKGIKWPKAIAPYQVSLIGIGGNEDVIRESERLHDELTKNGISVLFDDRDASAGVKFKDSDLIGIPLRLVLSPRTFEKGCVEWKEREKTDATEVKIDYLIKSVKEFYLK